jgi:regulator of RNase E activity RraA
VTGEESGLLDRLARLSTTSLADASKATTPLRVLPRSLQPVRPDLSFAGRALTVVARDDLMPVIEALRIAGPRDVLMIAGSEDDAVCGELFAAEALRRGVAGIVIDGYCRDRATLARLDLPVYARGSLPTAPGARRLPVVQVPITMGAVPVAPGDRTTRPTCPRCGPAGRAP